MGIDRRPWAAEPDAGSKGWLLARALSDAPGATPEEEANPYAYDRSADLATSSGGSDGRRDVGGGGGSRSGGDGEI